MKNSNGEGNLWPQARRLPGAKQTIKHMADKPFSPELQPLIDDGSVFERARKVYERAQQYQARNQAKPSEPLELGSQKDLNKILAAIHPLSGGESAKWMDTISSCLFVGLMIFLAYALWDGFKR